MTDRKSIRSAGPASGGPSDPGPDTGPHTGGRPGPCAAPTYSALDLMGEVYFGLWGAGKIPPGPMRDPEAAQRACADLLRAFGIAPSDQAPPAADTRRAADTVAVLCGVAA